MKKKLLEKVANAFKVATMYDFMKPLWDGFNAFEQEAFKGYALRGREHFIKEADLVHGKKISDDLLKVSQELKNVTGKELDFSDYKPVVLESLYLFADTEDTNEFVERFKTLKLPQQLNVEKFMLKAIKKAPKKAQKRVTNKSQRTERINKLIDENPQVKRMLEFNLCTREEVFNYYETLFKNVLKKL
jgi:hypothetical protein